MSASRFRLLLSKGVPATTRRTAEKLSWLLPTRTAFAAQRLRSYSASQETFHHSKVASSLAARNFSDKAQNGKDENASATGETPDEEIPVATKAGTATLSFDEKDGSEPNTEPHSHSTLKGDRSEYTVAIDIQMPDMLDHSDLNVLQKWYIQEGDIVRRNDILCDIETPDFTFGLVCEDEFDSIVQEISVPAGPEPVPDGKVICVLVHRPEDA